MICLEQNATTGALQIVYPQPSDLSSCSLVAGSYTETMRGEIFEISPAQGSQIAGSILAVWALAWAIRMIAQSLNVDQKETDK